MMIYVPLMTIMNSKRYHVDTVSLKAPCLLGWMRVLGSQLAFYLVKEGGGGTGNSESNSNIHTTHPVIIQKLM